MFVIQKKPYEKLLSDYQDKFKEINLLNAALDTIIAQTSGKSPDDPAIQKDKQDLINKMKEGKG